MKLKIKLLRISKFALEAGKGISILIEFLTRGSRDELIMNAPILGISINHFVGILTDKPAQSKLVTKTSIIKCPFLNILMQVANSLNLSMPHPEPS